MYKTIDERRVFFEKFAKEKGFDPLIPENWYKVTLGDFLKQKVLFPFFSPNVYFLQKISRVVRVYYGIMKTNYPQLY